MAIKVVTLAGSIDKEIQLVAEIAAEPDIEIAFRCSERPEALATLRAGGIDALLSVGHAGWFDFQCVEEARQGGVRLAGIASDPIEAEMLEIAGFTLLRDVRQLLEIQEPAHLQAPSAASERTSGKLIAVWGPKGSPGRTRIAIELATALAQAEPRTLLVDADLYGGDAAQLLGVAEEVAGIVQFCRMGARGELRSEGWLEALRRAPRGPVLLPGLIRPGLWAEVSTFGWDQVLDAVRGSFTTTLLDVGFCIEPSSPIHEGHGRNDVAVRALEAADQVIVVVRADPIGIRSFLWSFTDHRELLDGDRCVLVVNRVGAGEEAEVSRFLRRHVGRPPTAMIPDRPDHVIRAVWEGTAVAESEPSSPITEAIRELAARLGGEVLPRGFLTRLVGRGARV